MARGKHPGTLVDMLVRSGLVSTQRAAQAVLLIITFFILLSVAFIINQQLRPTVIEPAQNIIAVWE